MKSECAAFGYDNNGFTVAMLGFQYHLILFYSCKLGTSCKNSNAFACTLLVGLLYPIIQPDQPDLVLSTLTYQTSIFLAQQKAKLKIDTHSRINVAYCKTVVFAAGLQVTYCRFDYNLIYFSNSTYFNCFKTLLRFKMSMKRLI